MRRSRDVVRDLIALTGDERAFMDSTAAARLNAYLGNDAPAPAVARELAAKKGTDPFSRREGARPLFRSRAVR